MNRRRRRERGTSDTVPEPDPIVYDVHGVPVGVRLVGAPGDESETRASRHLARVTSLRATRELEGREWITLGLF